MIKAALLIEWRLIQDVSISEQGLVNPHTPVAQKLRMRFFQWVFIPRSCFESDDFKTYSNE